MSLEAVWRTVAVDVASGSRRLERGVDTASSTPYRRASSSRTARDPRRAGTPDRSRGPASDVWRRYRSMEEALAGASRAIRRPWRFSTSVCQACPASRASSRSKPAIPSVLVLMITVHDDDERIFEAMCAGACGYLLKKTPPEKLVESVREVVAGGAPMSPEIARRVVELFRKFRPPERADYHLTPHEMRLLGCSSTATTTRRRPRSSA